MSHVPCARGPHPISAFWLAIPSSFSASPTQRILSPPLLCIRSLSLHFKAALCVCQFLQDEDTTSNFSRCKPRMGTVPTVFHVAQCHWRKEVLVETTNKLPTEVENRDWLIFCCLFRANTNDLFPSGPDSLLCAYLACCHPHHRQRHEHGRDIRGHFFLPCSPRSATRQLGCWSS